MEGGPLIVPRKNLDTKRRRENNNSYRQTRGSTKSWTPQDGKHYPTDQQTKLLAKDKRRYQTIHKELRPMSENQSAPTWTLQIATVKQGPDGPCQSIATDFITDRPKSGGYHTIIVVIDWQNKMSHFIPCSKDLDAWQFPNPFMKEIVRL